MRRRGEKLVVAIGIFDGVHRGHQAILKTAVKMARRLKATPAALTFVAHPSRVLNPSHAVSLLQTFEERCRRMRLLGIKRILSLHFTRRLSKFTPSKFVEDVLFQKWNVAGVVVGSGFRFGRGRTGDVSVLRELGRERGVDVAAVAPVRMGGSVVQSTLVRRYVSEGRVREANRLLGYPLVMTGRIRKGSGIGRRLGASTLNIHPANEIAPKFGVYAGWLKNGRTPPRPAVMNFGVAPTVRRSGGAVLEVHVIDGKPVRYKPGRQLSVELQDFLRPEQKFSSVTELTRAIRADVRRAKKLI